MSWHSTLRRRDVETVQAYTEWLRKVEWQLFSTFTFAWRVSDAQADVVFKAFIDEMEENVRSPIAFVRGDEKRVASHSRSESGRHFHVLLTSRATLDGGSIAKTWRKYGGSGNDKDSAKVDPYDSRSSGAEYCLKMINETDGDWSHRNLDLFFPGHVSIAGNSRARRRASRNRVATS